MPTIRPDRRALARRAVFREPCRTCRCATQSAHFIHLGRIRARLTSPPRRDPAAGQDPRSISPTSSTTTQVLLERKSTPNAGVERPARKSQRAPETTVPVCSCPRPPPPPDPAHLAEIKAFRVEPCTIVMTPLYGKGGSRCFGSRRGPQLRFPLRFVLRHVPLALVVRNSCRP